MSGVHVLIVLYISDCCPANCKHTCISLCAPGRKDVAVELYKKGISELQKGIGVQLNGQGRWTRPG